MTAKAKICGLSNLETMNAAIDAGASIIGFVFFPPSPRNVDPVIAGELCNSAKGKIQTAGVFVNPDDALLGEVLKEADLDYIQLHGTETLERIQYIKSRFGKKVIKAISVASVSDIARAREYENHVDMLLFDAKPPTDMENALPGGNGLEFDWQLIAGKEWKVPWLLSGGLDETNVAQAIKISGAKMVDVSSGVEETPGTKNIEKINAFMKAIQEIE
ncbi:phosphoribosylanthranilate isomerase [Pseudemcibacter aquimaris]|uniref:phosphoribosylanthranilate isomerase n=1 Tax=Pseudemcibacter aquimaris TaxID=2857064 RepID=UPI0020135B6D|nr:phosphoribosylanthranilate isomerase [Pseudemcibacter aquimaris]MCC3862480.1 phosphoribosylanthranilate isomerase [Pseudemcibacter aquimaris]WDU59092.1 phosphoribosylanthranilate isomerase [Pseudemcibacter aquimaris]